jgi:tryptophan 2,3-dioxygenase
MIDKTVIIDHFITIRDLLISIQTPKSDAHRYSLGIIDHTIRGENVELLSLLIKTIDPSIKIIINSAKDSDTLVIKRIIRADEICNKKYDCILDIVKKQLQL